MIHDDIDATRWLIPGSRLVASHERRSDQKGLTICVGVIGLAFGDLTPFTVPGRPGMSNVITVPGGVGPFLGRVPAHPFIRMEAQPGIARRARTGRPAVGRP